ncbi:MAG: ABC transporter ATP-binding protein [Clostridiaceae bacterium]|nr:ABC transporter ATP-binding protein [Clostridiaceae bacterium]
MVVEVKSLKKYFPIKTGFWKKTTGYVKAVDDVNLKVHEGETLGLVGESGCGKTTLGRCILRAIEPTSGSVVFKLDDELSVDVAMLEEKQIRPLRKNMQMIFQDPYSSLNPRMTILDIIGEPLIVNDLAKGEDWVVRDKELMELVGLDSSYLKRYPHAFSGGQRQRIGIARALATNPRFIVCDEAVSALDVSVRAQILNLLLELQGKLNVSYLFISHDLSVIRHVSHRVAVMYVGKIVEAAKTDQLYKKPKHPYTEALLSAIPKPDPRSKIKRIILSGEVANPANPPAGCYFHPRCRFAQDICSKEPPAWREVEEDHYVACHLAEQFTLQGVDM